MIAEGKVDVWRGTYVRGNFTSDMKTSARRIKKSVSSKLKTAITLSDTDWSLAAQLGLDKEALKEGLSRLNQRKRPR